MALIKVELCYSVMPLIPLSQAIEEKTLKSIRLVATDIDGTLTKDGKFTPNLLQALTQLNKANIPVILITGRSAGWVQALNHYLPVAGAIAENGGVFYNFEQDDPHLLTFLFNLPDHRQNLIKAFQILQMQCPDLKASADNHFRLTDLTFDVENVSLSDLKLLTELCDELGWGFTYSTVQGHIKPKTQDKATGLLKVIQQNWPDLTLDQILTIGDSPNDESLFNSKYFPNSVGVANLLDYTNQLTYKPTYITEDSEVDGFCQLVEALCQSAA